MNWSLLGVGQYYYRFRFRRAPGKFQLLIFQITTTGKEQARVNEIIASVRGYRLPMPHEVWVAAEPGHENCYPQADRVIVVPAEFRARSERKARALEYTRRLRAAEGLGQTDVKILYNDDDVLPTRQYILTAFDADYDVCEGITAPRTEYGTLPAGHLVASHADDVRARQCLIYCSVFQGLLGKPLYVHGEGLTVTGAAEQLVTWDYPVFASEDLVFGQNAAQMGLRWGWFCESVELTSPWTLREYFVQRKRWLWGDIHAIVHRDVLPRSRAAVIAVKYLVDSAHPPHLHRGPGAAADRGTPVGVAALRGGEAGAPDVASGFSSPPGGSARAVPWTAATTTPGCSPRSRQCSSLRFPAWSRRSAWRGR